MGKDTSFSQRRGAGVPNFCTRTDDEFGFDGSSKIRAIHELYEADIRMWCDVVMVVGGQGVAAFALATFRVSNQHVTSLLSREVPEPQSSFRIQ